MKTLIAIVSLICLSGCATIFKGSSEKVAFNSDKPETKVYVNGQYMGMTPLETKLMSKSTYNVEFRKDGYESKTVVLTNSVGAGWIVLDVLFGVIPLVVDAATGNWYSVDQDVVSAALEPSRSTASKN